MSYDVFVSYSHADSDWVHNILVPRLAIHGFTVCTDVASFTAGKFGIEQMEEAVVESKRTLLVMTPAYLNSEWSTFENVMAQSLDPAAKLRKIIPVLVSDCDLPLRLRVLHYRDLRSDAPQEWDKLMRDLI